MIQYEILINGKVENQSGLEFKNDKRKTIVMRIFMNDELEWINPEYSKYVSIARSEKLKSILNF
jgi:hypothetical protein